MQILVVCREAGVRRFEGPVFRSELVGILLLAPSVAARPELFAPRLPPVPLGADGGVVPCPEGACDLDAGGHPLGVGDCFVQPPDIGRAARLLLLKLAKHPPILPLEQDVLECGLHGQRAAGGLSLPFDQPRRAWPVGGQIPPSSRSRPTGRSPGRASHCASACAVSSFRLQSDARGRSGLIPWPILRHHGGRGLSSRPTM